MFRIIFVLLFVDATIVSRVNGNEVVSPPHIQWKLPEVMRTFNMSVNDLNNLIDQNVDFNENGRLLIGKVSLAHADKISDESLHESVRKHLPKNGKLVMIVRKKKDHSENSGFPNFPKTNNYPPNGYQIVSKIPISLKNKENNYLYKQNSKFAPVTKYEEILDDPPKMPLKENKVIELEDFNIHGHYDFVPSRPSNVVKKQIKPDDVINPYPVSEEDENPIDKDNKHDENKKDEEDEKDDKDGKDDEDEKENEEKKDDKNEKDDENVRDNEAKKDNEDENDAVENPVFKVKPLTSSEQILFLEDQLDNYAADLIGVAERVQEIIKRPRNDTEEKEDDTEEQEVTTQIPPESDITEKDNDVSSESPLTLEKVIGPQLGPGIVYEINDYRFPRRTEFDSDFIRRLSNELYSVKSAHEKMPEDVKYIRSLIRQTVDDLGMIIEDRLVTLENHKNKFNVNDDEDLVDLTDDDKYKVRQEVCSLFAEKLNDFDVSKCLYHKREFHGLKAKNMTFIDIVEKIISEPEKNNDKSNDYDPPLPKREIIYQPLISLASHQPIPQASYYNPLARPQPLVSNIAPRINIPTQYFSESQKVETYKALPVIKSKKKLPKTSRIIGDSFEPTSIKPIKSTTTTPTPINVYKEDKYEEAISGPESRYSVYGKKNTGLPYPYKSNYGTKKTNYIKEPASQVFGYDYEPTTIKPSSSTPLSRKNLSKVNDKTLIEPTYEIKYEKYHSPSTIKPKLNSPYNHQ